jgi:uncharacterized membrane protein YgcG
MNEKNRSIAIILVVTLAIAGGGYVLSKINSNTNRPALKYNTDEEDAKLTSSVEDVTQIDNQKVTSIEGATVGLENGNSFTVSDPANIACKVGDIISGYDNEKQAFICKTQNPSTNQTETRYIQQPPVRDGILGDLLLYRFFTGNTFLNNNGYVANRANSVDQKEERNTTYTGSNGTVVKSSSLSKPVIIKPSVPKPSSSSSKSSSSSTSSKSSSSSSTSGHGGGFGGSGSSSS